MPDREDEGGEAPCFAHLFEEEEIPAPDRVIAVTVPDDGVTPAE
jgi:hypothetical protein